MVETNLRRKQSKFAGMVGMLLAKTIVLKTPVVILELYRNLETQKAYVARGVSKTLNSKHLQGLAIDLAFIDDIEDDGKINWIPDKYKELGEYWESLSPENIWGGRFGDKPETEKIEGWDSGHFQYGK